MSYQDTLAVLKALPPEKQRLTRYVYEEGTCRCVIGHLLEGLPYPKVQEDSYGGFQTLTISQLIRDQFTVQERIRSLGMTPLEAGMLQDENDCVNIQDETQEARFARIISWLETMVAKEATQGGNDGKIE